MTHRLDSAQLGSVLSTLLTFFTFYTFFHTLFLNPFILVLFLTCFFLSILFPVFFPFVQPFPLLFSFLFFISLMKDVLKGVFTKNERGYRLTAKNNRFWSLLIFLLSVASLRRKLLKTTNAEERSVHTNSESCNIWLGS